MTSPLTQGVHHVGLAVAHLDASVRFFTHCLGWNEVSRRDDYPAVFVSDGTVMLTLWATEPNAAGFDRRRQVGLHHLALKVGSLGALTTLHDTLKAAGVPIEFAPTPLGDGPAQHMMCFEPSGIRIEFFWPGT